ncbi:hypothetical protein HS125_09730 [bacterium]|nr:hypothetical protein [bacterium]
MPRHAVVVALFTCAAAASAQSLALPEWRPPAGLAGEKFARGGTTVRIWGGGQGLEPVHFSEMLPALFVRTLVFSELELPDGGLRWVFTGPQGGFSVWVDKTKVALYQRYYDSFGLSAAQNAERERRMPLLRSQEEETPYTGAVRSLRITVDHALGLTLHVNDVQVFRQTCLLTVSRHQLQLTGSNCRMTGTLVKPETAQARVTLDPAQTHQTMRGWGGITTPLAYRLLSPEGKRRWWEMVCEYNLRIQREYPIGTRLLPSMDNWDDLAYGLPHYYGDNFPNSEISDFNYIKTIRSLGGEVWFEFWALPSWMNQVYKDKDGNPVTDREGRTRSVADPEKWSDAMLAYCKASQAKAGAPPDVMGIQNEAGQPADIWYAMVHALRRKLDAAGFSKVRIHMADSSNLAGGIERAKVFTAEPEVWKLIDFAATHMYDYQNHFTAPDDYDALLKQWRELTKDRPFLSTELCINNSNYQIQSYKVALTMGQLYHKNLTLADACAIAYCWGLLNVVQPSFGWTRTLCVIDEEHGFVPKAGSHQLRVFGAYSRRILRGMARIGAETDQADLLVTAFAGPGDEATVVLLNRGTAPLEVEVAGAPAPFRWMETADPYHENRVEPYKGGAVTVAPGSLVTLTNVPLGELPAGFDPAP